MSESERQWPDMIRGAAAGVSVDTARSLDSSSNLTHQAIRCDPVPRVPELEYSPVRHVGLQIADVSPGIGF